MDEPPTISLSLPRPPKRRPFKLKAPSIPEHPLQAQLARVLTIEIAPPGRVSRNGVCWWAIDHANYAGEVPGIRMSRGIIAGVQHFFILYRGRAHHPEVKTDTGSLSDAQKSVCSAVLAAGGRVAVIRNAEDLLGALDEWKIPRERKLTL